jgi:HEAT repeat protein
MGLFVALALVGADAGRDDSPRSIERLAEEASVIVIGSVAKSQTFADGNLFVHTLDVEPALKGEPPEPLLILEERLSSLRLYRKGQRVLAFLQPAPDYSFFRNSLPAGRYVVTAGGRDGVAEIGPEADAAARAILSAYAERDGQAPDPRKALRLELRSGHSRFAADAVAQLEEKPDLARSLSAEDLEAVTACLRDSRVEDRWKVRLVRRLGAGDVPGAAPLLQALEPSSGTLIAARAEALADLGQPPQAAESESYLRHPEPSVRAFAVAQLASSGREGVVEELEAVALYDRAPEVRLAAIEALGQTGRADAAPVLARTFDSEDPGSRRASARAFQELGDAAAQDALGDLVFTGSRYEVQAQALLLLFSLGVTKQDAAVERIRTEHPDARIRRLIDEGIGPEPASDRHPRARLDP